MRRLSAPEKVIAHNGHGTACVHGHLGLYIRGYTPVQMHAEQHRQQKILVQLHYSQGQTAMADLLYQSFLLLGVAVVLLRILKLSLQPKVRNPPGPWKLPVIGSMHHLLACSRTAP